MESANQDETRPIYTHQDHQEVTDPGAKRPPSHGELSPPPVSLPPKSARRMPSWRMWTLLGILALVLIAAASGFSGYRAGLGIRTRAESTQVALQVLNQYELALQDMEAGQYNRARQRLEYIIQLDPNYPGVTEKLAEILLQINTTATPTVAPTPTVSPTPDMRGVEELYAQSQQHLMNSEWSLAIETLLTLRKADPNYQPVWVDDMLYLSLRNRGRDKILRDGDLEEGIYDLTLAEQFGPLDVDSKSYLTWAELYLRGASFWKLDWSQAVYYFAQVAPAMPNLRDGSGMTATERYRQSLVGYAEFFERDEDWCNAQEQYEISLTLGTDPEVEEKYSEAAQNCAGVSDEDDEDEDGDEEEPAPESTEGIPTEGIPPVDAPTEGAPTEGVPTEGTPAEATPDPYGETPTQQPAEQPTAEPTAAAATTEPPPAEPSATTVP